MNKLFPALVFGCLGLQPLHADELTDKIANYQPACNQGDAASCNELGTLYYQQGLYDKAELFYQRTLQLDEKNLPATHPDLANSLNNLAELYRTQSRYNQALPLYLSALKIWEKSLGAEHPQVATLLNNLGLLYDEQGLYSQAEVLYQRSLKIREKVLGLEHSSTAVSLNNLAALYKTQGRYESAEALLLRAVKIMEKSLGAQHPKVAISLNNLAELYRLQGRYEQAEPLYKKALIISEQALGKDHPDVALSLNNLGLLYQAQGRYTQAEPLYQRTLEIRSKAFGLDHPEVASVLNNLGLLYQAQQRFNLAEQLYQRALQIREKSLGTEHLSVATAADNLASVYDIQGKDQEAERLYQRALAIRTKVLGEEHTLVAGSLNNLAEFYRSQGEYQKAEPLYLRALQIDEKTLPPEHPDLVLDLSNLAILYQNLQQWDKAQQLWQRHLRLTNRFLERVLWGAGEQTRQAYIQQQENRRNAYLSFYSFRNLADEALYFSLSRKGWLLRINSEMAALAKNSSNPAIQQQVKALHQLKSQLATAVLLGKADRQMTQTLEEKINNLEMVLSQKVSRFKRGKTEVTPEQVLQKLQAEQVLVDFLVFTEKDMQSREDKSQQIMALVADKQHGVKLVKLGDMQPITEAIQTYRQQILPNAQGQLANREELLKPASQKLYQLLWQPLLPYLADKKQVYLVPDGILHLLPFKALQDEKGHYLAETQQITLLSSAKDIVVPPLSGKANPAVIFAAPVYGDKENKALNQPTRSIATRLQDAYFAPLEGAAAEGKALQELIKTRQPVKLFQGQQATESLADAIKAPRFLHFATHGFFLEQASENETLLTGSGLALSGANLGLSGKKQPDGEDGIFTALEVLSLNLEGTDLVTLSACETGVGDIQVGEGVYSLNRAFQEAGAKAVLSTLWSVADDQTKQFMQEFYTLLLNGDLPQQALQKTQLKFINDKNLTDPFFWAAFTVVGI